MVATAKKVGERRYRESFGRAYEDFAVGDIYEHRPGRTITETDNTWFTLLTMNKHPLHFDEEYARHSEFGRCIVASPFTVSLLVGMSVSDVSQKAIANLGWTDIKLTHPVYPGDTLYAESEVLSKREFEIAPRCRHRERAHRRQEPERRHRVLVRPHHACAAAQPCAGRKSQLLTARWTRAKRGSVAPIGAKPSAVTAGYREKPSV